MLIVLSEASFHDVSSINGRELRVLTTAQLTSGAWISIEVGDTQFSGLSQIAALELWGALAAHFTT